MRHNKEGYRSAFKATGLLGGVQLITVLISVLQAKVIAVLIGPSGYGLMSLFNTTVSLVCSATNMGLAGSTVRDVAKAYGEKDREGLTQITIAIRRCVYLTGILGALVTILLSPYLSLWTFKSKEYTWSFILLSIIVFFSAISGGNNAVIQGCRKLVYLSKSKIGSALLGLLLTIIIFYFWKEKGIVLYLILIAFSSLAFSFYFFAKIKKSGVFLDIDQSFKQSLDKGRSSVKLGIMLSLGSASSILAEYIIKSYITRYSGLLDVGFYQAGWAINTAYLGMVFSSMGTDYYPRLASVSANNKNVAECVNQQSEMALLILGPLIIAMIIFIHPLIVAFYSDKFISIVTMTQWLLIGSFIKAGSWAISYIFLAKGDGRTYLINEIGVQFIILPSYLVAFTYGGLNAMGYAFVLNYIIYFVWVSLIARCKYGFKSSFSFWKILGVMLIITVTCIIVNNLSCRLYAIAIQIILLIFLLFYAYYELNNRVDLKEVLSKILKRKKNE